MHCTKRRAVATQYGNDTSALPCHPQVNSVPLEKPKNNKKADGSEIVDDDKLQTLKNLRTLIKCVHPARSGTRSHQACMVHFHLSTARVPSLS